MAARRIVMPGGSGFLGTHVRARLTARGDHVVVLTRGAGSSGPGWDAVHWDPATGGEWMSVVDGADAIVHLSGKRVDCRPTRRNIDELISSRVETVSAIARAWRAATSPPPVWVQLSSLARYGDGGESVIDESTLLPDAGPRQMVEVVRRWEEAFADIEAEVPRSVVLRGGIGIGGRGDPATERLVWLARMGLAGKVGSGRQWVSWVSLDDFLAVMLRAIDDETMSGVYHVTSPHPVRNAEMMDTYRRLVGRRFGLASPRLVTRIGAWLIGSDPTLALTGRKAVPTRLLAEGYEFIQPDFAAAAEAAVTEVLAGDN